MTEIILLVIVLIVIGAIVGGGTNIMAIRMLFRPYKPLYFGSWRLPFTPGLIPKRRAEIADSLGKTVEEHLLTPEGIQKKMEDGLLLKDVEERLTNAVNELLQDDRTLDEWLEMHLEKKDQLKTLRESVEKGLETKVLAWIYEYKDRPVKDWLPSAWQAAIEEKIPDVSENILIKTEEYLLSDEGKDQIEQMVARFFESKKTVGGFIGRVAHRFSLSSAVTNELLRFLKQQHTKELLTGLLMNEWKQAMRKAPSQIISDETITGKVHVLSKNIVGKAPLVGEWAEPINTWSYKYEQLIKETILPAIMTSATIILSRYIKTMIKKIGIRDIVTQEVNQFPLVRLELMLMTIARKELKLIAILGALIGGLIGFIQGIVIVFFI